MLQKYKLDLRCSLFCSYLHQVHDLEFAQVEQEVVKGLQVGNASLKKMHEVCIILKKFLNSYFSGHKYYLHTVTRLSHDNMIFVLYFLYFQLLHFISTSFANRRFSVVHSCDYFSDTF